MRIAQTGIWPLPRRQTGSLGLKFFLNIEQNLKNSNSNAFNEYIYEEIKMDIG